MNVPSSLLGPDYVPFHRPPATLQHDGLNAMRQGADTPVFGIGTKTRRRLRNAASGWGRRVPARCYHHQRMDDFGLRLVLLVRVLVPFLFMMASVYLAVHILFDRLISSPGWLATVVIGTPIVVLMPAFWLEQQLPADTGFSHHLGPIMALT